MHCTTPPITPVQQRILDALDRYPILSPSLLYLLIQNGGGANIPTAMRLLRERGLVGSLPPQEDGRRSAYRYYAVAWREVLTPFLSEDGITPRFYGKKQERIARAFVLYPVMTPSLLGRVIHTSLIAIEDTLAHMVSEDILRTFQLGDARQAPRYYLSAYESVLCPFLPERVQKEEPLRRGGE